MKRQNFYGRNEVPTYVHKHEILKARFIYQLKSVVALHFFKFIGNFCRCGEHQPIMKIILETKG